jgi:signal peptidase II
MMLLWIIIIAASVILDQITKMLVVNGMALYESIPLIKNVLSFTYIHNYGAAWGMLSDHRWVFIVVTALAIIVMPIFLYKYRNLHWMFGLSLSLIIGGAIGNMIDRVFLGYVVDFIQATFIDFPVFNVADICVVCGAIMMFVYVAFIDKTLFADKPKAEKTEVTANDGTSDKAD